MKWYIHILMVIQVSVMEGLVSARVNPIRASSVPENSNFLHTFSSRAKRIAFGSIGIMKNTKSFNSVAAAVQPLETSTAGRFDNTLPSKGNIQDPRETPDANIDLAAKENFLNGVYLFTFLNFLT